MKPRLIVQQKITPFVNRYAVYEANASGKKGTLVAFAQQKRLAFKEKVTFYDNESKTHEVFSFRAEKVLDEHGRYLVEDIKGKPVGSFRKIFKQSLLISSWNILDDSGEPILLVKENSVALAIFRRFVGIIPIIGELLSILTQLCKYHFDFIDVKTGKVVGEYQKTTLFRDHYLLSVTDSAYDVIDWRTYAAMAVGLDALQSR